MKEILEHDIFARARCVHEIVDIRGMTSMELVGEPVIGTDDYIHGDLYEVEELFRQGQRYSVRMTRKHSIINILMVTSQTPLNELRF